MRYTHVVALLMIFSIAFSCTKNAGTVPEEVKQKDTLESRLAFPDTMRLIRVWPKGISRIFSNKKEIKDSVYARNYMYDAIIVHEDHFKPFSKLYVISKDTLGLLIQNEMFTYGIHKAGDVYKLHSRYPYPEDRLNDTAMVEVVPFGTPGKFRPVLTGYGNNKEFKIALFAFRHFRYLNETRTNSHQRMSTSTSIFKEDFVNTLTDRDTFALQEYEMVFK